MNTNTNKTAEELKRSEALEKAFWETFGCTSAEFAKGMAEANKQIAEYVKKNYPNAK